jgi:hypothetical protein
MRIYQLIDTTTLARLSAHPEDWRGLPARRVLPDDITPENPGDGMAYVPVEDQPEYDPATQTIESEITLEKDGWKIRELTEEEIAARVPVPTPEEKLAALSAAFKEAVPEAMRPAFAPSFAIVRTLVQAEEIELAASHIENLEVPEALAQAKASILALLA